MKNLTTLQQLENHKNCLVLVKSDTCPSCAVALQLLSRSFRDEVEYYILDFLNEEDICDTLDVEETPTYVFLSYGKVLGKMWGIQEPKTVDGFQNIHFNEQKT